MFLKITLAIALILGTASGALAAPKQKKHTNRDYDLYDSRSQHGASASRTKTTHVKTTHARAANAKTTRAKAAHVRTRHLTTMRKQAHRANRVYFSYESRNWSSGGATSALTMTNPRQNSSRHYELYNTRAQYSGLASRAAEMPKRHSSNPSYDVYDTRGWYVGSDPDPTVRFMLARDPSHND